MTGKTVFISPDRCDFCGTCVAVCRADAITLKESSVFVDPETCVRCGDCLSACPFGIPEEVP